MHHLLRSLPSLRLTIPRMLASYIYFCRTTLLTGLLFLAAPTSGAAQQATAPTAISLADALTLAVKVSHSVRTAEAGVQRAHGQQLQAKSQFLPQINGIANYQRTFESQFAALSSGSSSTTTGSTSSTASSSGSSSGSTNSIGNISKIFASPNTMTLGLSLSQNVFTAGRLLASEKGAEAARTAADINLDAARAQLALDVAQAYFDAVASEQLALIADSTLAQAERTLQQTTVSRQVGSAAEFDLLRARVARDNQRPALIAARGNRDVALMRLRQLLGVPLNQPLALTTPIRDEGNIPVASAALSQPIDIPGRQGGLVPDTTVGRRASVRQAEANVDAQQFAFRAAQMNRLPSVQLSSSYQRFAYPTGFLPGSLSELYPNWTASVGLSFPVFLGGKLTGDRMIAEANVIEARQSLEQVRELAALDARTAVNQLAQAEASYAASVGTDEQAAKAYSIAEVRFREGISTQVELLQSRTQYEQARVNRVTAARDLEVARLRVAFLKDLPLGTGAASQRPAAGR